MSPRAGHLHWVGAGRAGGRLSGEFRALLLPGPHRPGPVLHLEPNVLVTGGQAGVAAGQGLVALLFTGRTGPGMAVVLSHLTVVTVRGCCTHLLTPGRFD